MYNAYHPSGDCPRKGERCKTICPALVIGRILCHTLVCKTLPPGISIGFETLRFMSIF